MTPEIPFQNVICWVEDTRNIDLPLTNLEATLNYLDKNATIIHQYVYKTEKNNRINIAHEDITTFKVHYFSSLNAVTSLEYKEHTEYDLDLEKTHSLKDAILIINCKEQITLNTLTNELLEIMKELDKSSINLVQINNPK